MSSVDVSPRRMSHIARRDTDIVKSAARVLKVFEYFETTCRPSSAAELADTLNLPRSSTNELLKTLLEFGYLDFNARDKSYWPSFRTIGSSHRLAHTYFGGTRLLDVMAGLNETTGMSVMLTVENGRHMQFVTVMPGRLVRTYPAEGSKVKIIGPACGGALLMTKKDPEILKLAQFHGMGLSRQERDALGVDVLRRVIVFRRQGYAANFGRSQAHVSSVAVPLMNPSTQSPIILSLAGAKTMMTAGIDEAARRLRDAVARELTDFALP
jgi:DNA-binding IclR family transcriptional regulator